MLLTIDGDRTEESTMATLVREVVGDVLRGARTSQGRTLREVSDSARVSLGYLSEVERGRKEPSSELLNAICDALQVPLSQVLIDAGERMATRGARHPQCGNRCHHRCQHQGRDSSGGFSGGCLIQGLTVPDPPDTPQGWGDPRRTGNLSDRVCRPSGRQESKAELTDGQSVRQSVEVPRGAVQLQD